MRHIGIFFLVVLLISCNEDDSRGKIKIIGQIYDEVAFLDIEQVTADSLSFVFELQSHGEYKYLSVTDSNLICDTLTVDYFVGWHSAYLRHYISKNDSMPSWTSGRRLWYNISGDVLSSNSKNTLVA